MIYFLQSESGPIKIGYAHRSIEMRLNAIRWGLHEQVVLLLVVNGEKQDEKSIHRALATSRVRGEWYAPSDEVLTLIESKRPEALPVRWRGTPPPTKIAGLVDREHQLRRVASLDVVDMIALVKHLNPNNEAHA